MASPYLPAAQALFAAVYRLAPDSPLAFQVAAVLFDLLTGWMVVDLLRRLDLPQRWSVIYFWHPLVVIECAHGGHVDAWMVCLTMASLWALVVWRSRLVSVIALTAATLTKGLPALLLPVLARRWRWPYALLYLTLLLVVCLPFGFAAGWGLSVPLDGEGLLGAMLIYGTYWNYNSGLYHWLEVLFSGYLTPSPVPQEAVGPLPIYAAKAVVALGLGGIVLAVWRTSRRLKTPLALLRLAIVPLVAYLLLATTVHPWYATWIVPLLPFLGQASSQDEVPSRHRDAAATVSQGAQALSVEGASLCPMLNQPFLWPLLYFTLVLPLAYLSYLDPAHIREYATVRLIEYVPLFLLLMWAVYRQVGSKASDALSPGRQRP